MVRGNRAGTRRRFADKMELTAAGAEVRALTYERASKDKKKQGKSVGDQRKLNLAQIDRFGWTHAGGFQDNDLSASRHAKKTRPEFELLMDAIRDGAGDVLVVWEVSRSQRDLAVYVQIRNLCIDVGLRFWLVDGALYDLTDKNDRMALGFQAVQAEFQADYIKDNVRRGIDGAAAAGRPHGHWTYGYQRIYDQHTKAYLRQVPDETLREATGPGGAVETYSTADIVREIFDRVVAGDALSKITNDLNDRGVLSPWGKRWRRAGVRNIALRDAYLAKRVLRGEVVGDGDWPALVTEETFWAARRILSAPERNTTKPGKARYLLSYLATCAECRGPLGTSTTDRHKVREDQTSNRIYRCRDRSCVWVRMDHLDEYVERIVVAFLSREDVAEAVHQRSEDAEVAHAHAEVERLSADLEEARALASSGQLKPVDFVRIESGLSAQIATWEAKAAQAGLPPVLRGWFGPHAEADWLALKDNVAVKREIIRAVLAIELGRTPRSASRNFTTERVGLRWLIGPDADSTQKVRPRTLPPTAARRTPMTTTAA